MTTDRRDDDLHLVGSMPLETVEDVLTACEPLAPHLRGLPDGEVGPRRFWTPYLPLRTFSGHPDLEEMNRPEWAKFLEQGHQELPEDADENEPWLFKIKDGVEGLEFDSLHYAEPALASYAAFEQRRKAGELPADLRFQVSIPSTDGVIEDYFPEQSDWPAAKAAYLAAAFREIEAILAGIPADDLVIQWDLALEFVSIASAQASGDAEAAYRRHMASVSQLAKGVPAEVPLGYHLCYGTWGGWPMTDMRDLGLCVRVANELTATAGRPIQFVHMPVVQQPDEAFFAPLADLEIGDAKLYLGLVHHDDEDDGDVARRIALARKFADGFGVGGVCGFGRLRPAEVPMAIERLEDGIAALQAAS